MFPFRKRKPRPSHQVDEATKAEILKLIAGVEASRKSRYPRLALLVKLGSGYLAMAVFTIASLTFSAFSLYAIHDTAREIASIDLPTINSLNRLRTSLLAQENFAGKYVILQDRAFIELFRQREKETLASFNVLEKTGAVEELEALRRLYGEYQAAADRLFTGKSGNAAELRSVAVRILGAVDTFSARRQEMLQAVLNRADYLRESAVRWTIIISCSGLALAIVVGALLSYRILGALKRLQTATHRLAAGNLDYDPIAPVGEELRDLAANFSKIAERLKVLEERKGAAATVAPEKAGDTADAPDVKE